MILTYKPVIAKLPAIPAANCPVTQTANWPDIKAAVLPALLAVDWPALSGALIIERA